jgi:Ca2+-transporting ATPase
MSFLPLAFGGPLFLYPVHVVFLEFVIDPACTLVYEAERSEEGAMERPPRDPRQPLFDLRMLGMSLALGVTMLAGVFAAYWWALMAGRTDGETRAVGFAAMVLANLALILVTRSRVLTLFETLRQPNPAAWWITASALGALALSIYAPPVAHIFRFAPLSIGDLAAAAAAGIGGVLWYEVWKLLRRPKRVAAAAQ